MFIIYSFPRKSKEIPLLKRDFLLYKEYLFTQLPSKKNRISKDLCFYKSQENKSTNVKLQSRQWLQANHYCFWNCEGKLLFLNSLQNIHLVNLDYTIFVDNISNSTIQMELKVIYHYWEVDKIKELIIEKENSNILYHRNFSEKRIDIKFYLVVINNDFLDDFLINYGNKWGIFFLSFGNKIINNRKNLIGNSSTERNAHLITKKEALLWDGVNEERIIIY